MVHLAYLMLLLPLAGFAVLTVILITLVAHRALPYKVPGALAAVAVSAAVVYRLAGPARWRQRPFLPPHVIPGIFVNWRAALSRGQANRH